jgi:hypothetical protein
MVTPLDEMSTSEHEAPMLFEGRREIHQYVLFDVLQSKDVLHFSYSSRPKTSVLLNVAPTTT